MPEKDYVCLDKNSRWYVIKPDNPAIRYQSVSISTHQYQYVTYIEKPLNWAVLINRSDVIRTRGPYLPKIVLYQLSHTPTTFSII